MVCTVRAWRYSTDSVFEDPVVSRNLSNSSSLAATGNYQPRLDLVTINTKRSKLAAFW